MQFSCVYEKKVVTLHAFCSHEQRIVQEFMRNTVGCCLIFLALIFLLLATYGLISKF